MLATTSSPPLICALAYDDLCTFEYGIAVEVFGSQRTPSPLYRFATVAAECEPLRAMGGLILEGAKPLSLLDRAHTIIIPGWSGPDEPVPDGLRAALVKASQKGVRLVSICSGAFVLARAGLLRGRCATTHWRYLDKLADIDPSIRIEPNVLYVEDGHIMTSAGSAAGLDLCLHLVRHDHGIGVANAIARSLVLPAHREGGQAQYIPKPIPSEYGRMNALLETIQSNLSEPWTIATMAETATLSPRTLLRRFQETLGMSKKNGCSNNAFIMPENCWSPPHPV